MLGAFSLEAMMNFLASLNIMWKCMLGIFVFMGVFYLLIHLFTKIFPTGKAADK